MTNQTLKLAGSRVFFFHRDMPEGSGLLGHFLHLSAKPSQGKASAAVTPHFIQSFPAQDARCLLYNMAGWRSRHVAFEGYIKTGNEPLAQESSYC